MKTGIAFFILLLCCIASPVIAKEPVDVSLIQLIANPKDYDGKNVRVIGFVRLEFEGNAIYLHEDDFKHGVMKNGLWLDAPKEMFEKQADFNQKYVLIEGTFNAKMTGHLGLWSGSIQKITRFQLLSGRQ
jgi:hypothetical protein